MNKLCRQVSIESPGPIIKDCVFSFEVPVPDVPAEGARIRVVCAGACYRMRTRSPSTSSVSSVEDSGYSPAHHGVRDGALFPGYEVAGVVDALGSEVTPSDEIKVGSRVVLYPYDGIPHGYAEYIVVPSMDFLVPVPDNLPLGVAAMLPTGALLAKNAVVTAHKHVVQLLQDRATDHVVRILIVGTGGLALWALRIAEHHFQAPEYGSRVKITVATLKDEGFMRAAAELKSVNIVQWNEDLYEKQLIERTKNACNGLVDIVIDFGTTSRSLHRSLQCLNSGGVVLVSEEVAERLLPKFSRLIHQTNQKIEPVANGSIEQLRELVKFVATGDIVAPPHTEFSADEASKVVEKLCHSEIPGRAILRFHDIQ
ncbi:highly reducing polyketide synthase SAT13 isoform X2 [Sitophilus oryzae]|nr:highly reducing polyketide synthase SAT13 isoform X2 [Sitophilus oryzae]